MGRLHVGVPLGLGRRLIGRWYNWGAALVVPVVGLGRRLVGRRYNPGAAVVLAVPSLWALPIAKRGQAE